MQPSTKPRTVVGFFSHPGQMKRAVEQLRRAGFSEDRISAHERDGWRERGLFLGVTIGTVLGALAGILAAGRMMGMRLRQFRSDPSQVLPGAMIGAVLGSMVGTAGGTLLVEKRIDYEYEELSPEFNVMIVDAGDRYGRADEILRNNGAYRTLHRYPEWRTGFRISKQAFEAGDEIRIPVFEEKVEVEKVPVVAQQFHVRKRKVGETREISDVVKGEAIKVGRHGDVEVHVIPKEGIHYDESNH